MGLSYRKSMKLGPVRVNFSNSGVGYSVGLLGTRITKTAKGHVYKTTYLPLGFLHRETLSTPKKETKPKGFVLGAKKPWAPSKYIDLSGGEEFWLDLMGEEAESAQSAIAAAVADAGDNGATEPVIAIGLMFVPGYGLTAVVDNDKGVGLIPESDARFTGLAKILDSQGAAGRCLALVFDEDGRLGLKLNLTREAVDMDIPSPPEPVRNHVPVALAIAGGVLGVGAALARGLFGGRRR